MSKLKTTEAECLEGLIQSKEQWALGEDDSGLHCSHGINVNEDALDAHRVRCALLGAAIWNIGGIDYIKRDEVNRILEGE